jgi:hypothetical protein
LALSSLLFITFLPVVYIPISHRHPRPITQISHYLTSTPVELIV